jgi:hypothetical protein
VAATLPGEGTEGLCPSGEGGEASFRCGTAYEADPADFKTTGLRFHRNIATVNLTFPAVEPPPPPPAIGVVVYRMVDGAGGHRGSCRWTPVIRRSPSSGPSR